MKCPVCGNVMRFHTILAWAVVDDMNPGELRARTLVDLVCPPRGSKERGKGWAV